MSYQTHNANRGTEFEQPTSPPNGSVVPRGHVVKVAIEGGYAETFPRVDRGTVRVDRLSIPQRHREDVVDLLHARGYTLE